MKPPRPDPSPDSIHDPSWARVALRLLDRSGYLVRDMDAAHRRELESSTGGIDQLGVEADITSVTDALEELINSCHRAIDKYPEVIDER